ncbi:amino acid/amide ABC transporter substrate-binding protein, HAAT family [Rhizobiales bacterium GAS188]|nr:amino acid/amide ABC transporter substrate-binding protein, HAAT family [Rhizobiales bacterium GAS188]
MKRLMMIGAAAAALSFSQASADGIKIGITISQTGPGASLGIPQAKTVPLLPKQIAGQSVDYIVLDDGSDATKAVANARKLVTDEKVDALVGGSTTPASVAVVEVAAETKTPFISLAGSSAVISPMDDKKKWAFKSPQNDALMAAAIAEHMAKAGVKSVGFIGFADAYGDGWLNVITPLLDAKGIKLLATEKYARADTSVTGQVLKILAAKPDVVLIAGAGTPAALPAKTLRERGFTGPVYQTHGAGNNDFLRVGAKDVEDTIMPAGPVLVAAQLPDANASKARALEYVTAYEGANGKDSVSTFGAHIFDADILLQNAIPVALKAGKPGTPEFRQALRDALEGLKEVVYSHGVATMSPTDHVGQDARSRVMVTVKDGRWKLMSGQ